jgi:sialate O-acetylesterase
MRRFHFAVLSLALLTVLASADIQLPKVLADHMVLQRETEVAIWGWASPGERVRVRGSWMNEDRTGNTNASGQWLVRIPTPEAGGPFTVTVSGENTITLSDVLIGEVWVASGQSNMEWPVGRLKADDARRTMDEADDDQLRLFKVARAISLTPRADCEAVPWHPATGKGVQGFSAVAYFFARELRERLGVPVGVIESDWGGTRVEAWMSPQALTPFEEYTSQLEMIHAATTNPGSRAAMIKVRDDQWWDKLDAKAPKGWKTPGFDASGWHDMNLPATLKDDGLGTFDGVLYFRRTIDLPQGWDGKAITLGLGPIDDYDDVWVNGVHIGATHAPNQWNVPRKYQVPGEAVRGGSNVIAIRMLDTSGPGGINGNDGQMYIQKEDMLVPISGSWKYARGPAASKLPPRPTGIAVNQNTPTALYHGMLTPILPYTIRGAIWYQGESNVSRAARYADLFPAMIQDWRNAFESGPISFYFVQIAPFGYRNDTGQAALLRDSQRTTLALENTGMAVTMDIGNPGNIHPLNKRDVGDRLARWALAKDYGQTDLTYSGPLYKSAEVENGRITIHFDHADGGLVARGGPLTHFTIAGKDRNFRAASAEIVGNTIVVSSPDVVEPVAVRFGWGAADEPNLFNGGGLPASSFRTDDWE